MEANNKAQSSLKGFETQASALAQTAYPLMRSPTPNVANPYSAAPPGQIR